MSETDPDLSVWTIYDSPSDFPGLFVTRRWDITRTGPIAAAEEATADSLQQARDELPPGLSRIERASGDDPTIVETWL